MSVMDALPVSFLTISIPEIRATVFKYETARVREEERAITLSMWASFA